MPRTRVTVTSIGGIPVAPPDARFNAMLFRTDGTEGETIALDPKNLFQSAYPIIGGGCDMIELVRLNIGGVVMLVDEEGLVTDQPYNPNASALAGRHIVGNAIIVNERLLK